MKKLFLLIAVMAFMVHKAGAQMFNPVIFSVAENRITDTEIEIVFTGQVEEGWHVYGVDIPAGGPTAAKLTLETCQGAELKGELRAIGDLHREMDNLFGMEVSFMEGKAVFAQTLTLTDSLYNISGYLTYGACNNENCMPPTDVDFAFSGSKSVNEALVEEATEQASAPEVKPEQKAAASSVSSWWKPVVQELHSFGDEMKPVSDTGLWSIFLLGFLGGFVALLTPCVWPIIPMTVSFFLKRSSNRQKGIRDAVIYGISIIVIYVSLGLLVTLLFGASALNSLSTNAAFNIFFFLMLLVFGASFLGGFEITLPSSWSNAVDRKSENTTGLLSIFLMAFTLSLVSFSCTGPIIGFLLVEIGSTGGASLAPAIGMLGFALALALPFTLFAMFATTGALVCIGAADAFFALLFFLADIDHSASNNGRNNQNNDNILHMYRLSLHRLLCRQLSARVFAEPDDDRGNDQHRDQAGHKARPHRSGGDQGSDLINQEGYGVARGKLQTHTAPKPLAVIELRVHGAQRSEARGREQIEHQVSQCRHLGDCQNTCHLSTCAFHHGKLIRIDEIFQANEAHRQRAHHIFLGDEACNGRGRQLPGTHTHNRDQ